MSKYPKKNSTFFKDEPLTGLYSVSALVDNVKKNVIRRVKQSEEHKKAMNFRFFKNVLLYMNGGRSKIRSVHTYVMTWTVYFD